MLDARCRKTNWLVNRVELVNISEGGCCIVGRIDGLGMGDEVVLRIASHGAVSGRIRWVEKRRAGIAFNDPLSAKTVNDLATLYTVGEVTQAGQRAFLKAG